VEGLRGLAVKRGDVACVLADEPWAHIAFKCGLGRGNDRVAERLSPTRDAEIRFHLDQKVVHAGKSQPRELLLGCTHVEGNAHIVCPNTGDPHGPLLPGVIVALSARMLALPCREKEGLRRMPVRFTRSASLLSAAALLLLGNAALAQAPKRGGILNFAVVAEPPTTDCHATTTFAMVHPVAPQYSTLLMFTGPHDNIKIEGDLAESWEVSNDGLTYTFKMRKGVKFHDRSDFTAQDIKATYERIINPAPGVVSSRKAQHQDIKSIETPDPYTVVFKLGQVNMSMPLHFASPFNCVYSAKKLAENPRYPETEVMGTGAFKFVEYQKGSHWTATRFEQYFRKDRPYLDGYKAIFVRSNTVVAGLRGGQYDAEFRGRTPQERDQLLESMKDKGTVLEGPWVTNILITFNTEHKPFDAIRVRQALSLGIGRWGGSASLGKISLIKGVGGPFRPGAEWSLPAQELEQMPGFWRDIEKSRAEARRLLQEAGH